MSSEQAIKDKAIRILELAEDKKNLYAEVFKIIQEGEPGVLLDVEIRKIKATYPSFAHLSRALCNNDNTFKCQPELLLSFKLNIHPIASLAVYNIFENSSIGHASTQWRQRFPYDGTCISDLETLNEFWMIHKTLASLPHYESSEDADDEKKDSNKN